MKDRIRYSLIYVGVLAALFAVYFTSKVFEDEMTTQLKASLQEKSHLVEVAYESTKTQLLSSFASDSLRITLVDSEGTVVYESDHELAKMENHKARPEINDAYEKGVGENLRYSVTLNAKVFYFAKKTFRWICPSFRRAAGQLATGFFQGHAVPDCASGSYCHRFNSDCHRPQQGFHPSGAKACGKPGDARAYG